MTTQPEETQAVVEDVSETPEAAETTAQDIAEQLAEEWLPEEEEQAEPDGEAETSEEEAEPEAEAAPAIEAPTSWSKEDKEVFQSLTPEAQAIIARRESERDKFVQSKAQEAANTRQSVEREALQAIAQLQSAAAEQLQRYAQQIEPQEPDVRLLQTGNPEHQALYLQQDAAYRQALAQRSQAQQEAQQRAEAAQKAEAAALDAERAQEQQALRTQFPEWFDPSEGPKLAQTLQSIGSELGYSPEQMREARAVDILGLRKAAEWKAKADQLDKLNKSKMETVRAAKKLPPVTKPGAAQSPSAVRTRNANVAWDEVKRSKSPDAFAEYLTATGIL